VTIPRTPDGEPQRRINVELLDRIEQQITEHPETWDQDAWFRLPRMRKTPVATPPCGTTLCVAGWAVSLSGYKLVPGRFDREGYLCIAPDGQEDIAVAARRLLGLSEAQADRLFGDATDLDAIREQFAELRAEASR
jgi:hypothetical protein